MPYPNHSAHDVEQLYALQIRQHVEPGADGKFVVIDIDTADYELDVDDLSATQRLLARRPSAVLYGLRIGQSAAYTPGGHMM